MKESALPKTDQSTSTMPNVEKPKGSLAGRGQEFFRFGTSVVRIDDIGGIVYNPEEEHLTVYGRNNGDLFPKAATLTIKNCAKEKAEEVLDLFCLGQIN